MSAIDELRRLLDERGVEHFGDGYLHITSFFMGGVWASVTETSTGKLMLRATFETPEQAIAATLGPCNCSNSERTGTCHNVHEPPKDETFWPAPHFKCSGCGATHVSMEYVFYCPNCGRKVVDE